MSNDEARKTLAKLLNEDKTLVGKIKLAQSEAIKAQKKLEELKQKRAEIDAKLQLLSDATSQLSNTPQQTPENTQSYHFS
jgi:hypothetical protein|nr:MAG TPA: hypothetical protein [Caudoviricetes sp.]